MGSDYFCWYTTVNGKDKKVDCRLVESLGKLAVWRAKE
jgi:hypothetical protein